MGIFSRFADIVNSNINALLDSAEDPQKMIRLIIQEMEETLVEVRSTSAKIIADKKTTTRRLERLLAEADEWEAKAKLALQKGREDLARAALTEKAGALEEADVVKQELQTIEDHLVVLSDEVAQLQTKLDDAKAKQKALLLRATSAEQRYKVKTQTSRAANADAFTKFELFERRLEEMEGRVEAMDMGKQDLASEIDALAEDDKINDELSRLKQEINQH